MERKYQSGISAGYQRYWVLFCLATARPFDHAHGDNHEFISWINKQHKEFEPDEFNRLHKDYPRNFTAHMLNKIQFQEAK